MTFPGLCGVPLLPIPLFAIPSSQHHTKLSQVDRLILAVKDDLALKRVQVHQVEGIWGVQL